MTRDLRDRTTRDDRNERQPSPFESRHLDLIARNIEIARGHAREEILAGYDPLAVLDDFSGRVQGFVSGRLALIVPPDMIPPGRLAAAIKRGKELAKEYGW